MPVPSGIDGDSIELGDAALVARISWDTYGSRRDMCPFYMLVLKRIVAHEGGVVDLDKKIGLGANECSVFTNDNVRRVERSAS